MITCSLRHNTVPINPEVRKILLKLPGKLLYILFYFIVYTKSEIWCVSGYWSKTHYRPKGTKANRRKA